MKAFSIQNHARKTLWIAITTITAILALAVLVLPSSAVRVTAATEDWLPGIRDSRELSGLVLATGRLVDADGRGIAGRIVAVAWPTMEVLGVLEDGDRVKTITVAKTTAGPGGEFTLRVDPSVPIAEYMEPNGTINFDLRAIDDKHHVGLFAFARRLDAEASMWVEPGSSSEGPADPVTVTLGAAAPPPAEGAVPIPAMDKGGLCPDTVVATYNEVWSVVGEVYTGPHAYGDFTYINGSSSTLGVGFSSSGSFGSYSQNGTASSSSTTTLDYPIQGYNAMMVPTTTFQYKKFKVWSWVDDGQGGYCYNFGYEVRPTAFQGGRDHYYTGSAPSATYCSPINTPGPITKQSANAVTFSDGVQIGGSIGVDLSSKTGFNSQTKIVYDFQSAGQLCGTDDYYPDASRVVAK